MKELIEKYWSQDPKNRPSFNEIFEKLPSITFLIKNFQKFIKIH